MEKADKQIKAFRRFLELLPNGKDKELIILKAHLLIEEQINLVLQQKLANPLTLAEAKLDCHQKICLAQSLFPLNHYSKFWNAIKKLNSLRNHVAHNIDLKGLNDKIDDFVNAVPVDWVGSSKEQTFELSLWSLFANLSSFVDGSISDSMKLIVPVDKDGSKKAN
jgi:hypothetical protein